MANSKHTKLLKQGAVVWNQWRIENPNIKPDLSFADLSKANLSKANLNDANLWSSGLSSANLSQASLRRAGLREADLVSANLNGANLSGARLHKANLNGANLIEAKIDNADLSQANLHRAHLRKIKLRGAKLREAKLSEVELMEADLRYADLIQTDFSEASFLRVDFTDTQVGRTVFSNVDLSEVKGLDTIQHFAPSYIDIRTVYRSNGDIPEIFLRGAGVPDNFITYMHSLTGTAFDFYSCFISHSSKDQLFAERLHADLQAKGVRCWYAPEDLIIGEPFVYGIDKGIRLHDKVLLVLSKNSLQSNWVETEVLSALTKEKGKEPWVLFPVRLDDSVMTTNVHWANMIRQSRHIGDFTRWKNHDTYRRSFDRLLRDLKRGAQA